MPLDPEVQLALLESVALKVKKQGTNVPPPSFGWRFRLLPDHAHAAQYPEISKKCLALLGDMLPTILQTMRQVGPPRKTADSRNKRVGAEPVERPGTTAAVAAAPAAGAALSRGELRSTKGWRYANFTDTLGETFTAGTVEGQIRTLVRQLFSRRTYTVLSARALQTLVEERSRAVPKAGHVNLLRGADLSLDGIGPYLHEVAHHVGPVWVRKIASGDPLFPVIIDCFKGGNVVARRDVEQACQAKNIPFSASRFRSLIEEFATYKNPSWTLMHGDVEVND